MIWALMPLQRYAEFSGRSRRKEYWMFSLFAILISIGFGYIDILAGTSNTLAGFGLFQALFDLALTVPSLAVTTRRLHDTGKSGWVQLLFLIPLIGLIVIIWLVNDSDQGDNQYGPNPKTTDIYPPAGTQPMPG
jgi:uncharacterized membrane protein YhaH (DUF805 family)